jgi:hypothetical protein
MPVKSDEHVANLSVDHWLYLFNKGCELSVADVLRERCLILHADVLPMHTGKKLTLKERSNCYSIHSLIRWIWGLLVFETFSF